MPVYIRGGAQERLDPDWGERDSILYPETLAENLAHTNSRKQAVGNLMGAF
jgi:hypothetical protein